MVMMVGLGGAWMLIYIIWLAVLFYHSTVVWIIQDALEHQMWVNSRSRWKDISNIYLFSLCRGLHSGSWCSAYWFGVGFNPIVLSDATVPIYLAWDWHYDTIFNNVKLDQGRCWRQFRTLEQLVCFWMDSDQLQSLIVMSLLMQNLRLQCFPLKCSSCCLWMLVTVLTGFSKGQSKCREVMVQSHRSGFKFH